MHYLARALPVGDTQRFVLTDKFGDGRWTRLGVVPIPFPNYGTLYSGIRELAKYRSRGILDWQHEIREIADSDPPTGAYETETLAEAFSDPARTRFFTTSARDPAWIDWLDRHRRLINLLRGQDPLTEPERELARWLAKAFAWNHPDELWRIIGRHRMRLHPEFWRLLTHEVGLRDANVTDAKILSRWVSVLLATASHASDTELQYLAERCVKHGDVDGLIAVFEHVTTVTLRFSRFFTGLHGDAESRSVPTVLAELDVANADYPHTAAYVWKNGLQPKLGQIAGRLLTYVVSNLKTQHRTRSTWAAASRNWDPLSMSRFAIEVGERTPHTQIPDISDVLIDSARDCLEWLATSEPVGAAHWCDQLARHAGLIADVLQALTRNTDMTGFEELIELADTVALDLWKSMDGQETPEDSDDWLIKSWTHPAGVLTQFWIDSLAIWKKRKVHRAVHFERYKERFSAIVRDGTAIGRLGRCILSRNLSILLTSEEGWTKDNLLPLFYDYPRRSKNVDYFAVWDGLLRGTIAAPEAQILKIPFLDATERMAKEAADSSRRKRFVECYTFMLTFFAGDPVGTWIPLLLKWVSEEERITFVRGIHERLENMDEVQQANLWQRWIKRYWRNRGQAIPDGLQPREAWHMLRWLPLLRRVFPDAVDVALCAAPNDMDPEVGRNMVFALSQSDLPASYPIHVAKLLIYLGNCENYNSWYAGRELVDRLLQHDLPDGLKTGLKELVAQKGLQ